MRVQQPATGDVSAAVQHKLRQLRACFAPWQHNLDERRVAQLERELDGLLGAPTSS